MSRVAGDICQVAIPLAFTVVTAVCDSILVMPSSSAGHPKRTPVPRRRSMKKRAAIMATATECFLEGGYLGTTVDEIAARAGVAKQTIYEHFDGKEQLFKAIVLAMIDEAGQPFFETLVEYEERTDLEGWLTDLARGLAMVARDRRLLELRRLVVAEVGRFPDLGRSYYERGPGRTTKVLAEAFSDLDRRGLLRVDDAQLAAQHFNWLVVSIPINAAMFGLRRRFTRAELDSYADDAVRVFLAAYARSR